MTTIQSLKERFLNYVKTYSQSSSGNADNGIIPSTPQQWDIAKIICSELENLGLENVQTTENCYTYGYLKATPGFENTPSFCLLAHIDTVEEVSGKNVEPLVFEHYDGKPVTLPAGIILNPEEDKALSLAGKNGETIITSSGSTLLGADDKAGVAEIITCIEYLVNHPEEAHGPVEVCFSPDEETGHGMDKVPLNLIKSKFAYTVDGGHIGELETECFNAYKSEIFFTGKSKHTGTARPDMVNAVTMASHFLQNLPANERPETTDGYQGFYAPMNVSGSIENAQVTLFLRDFSEEGMKKRIQLVENLAALTAQTTGGKCKVKHTRQYLNMKNELDKNPCVTEKLLKAYKKAGVEPVFTPIRGGTDGSRLTEMGIPAPNIFTGGHNFHSLYEWASLDQMYKTVQILIELSKV